MGIDYTYESKNPSILMKDVKKVVLHNHFYAAIKNDGTLWTWGVDRYGNLGLGTEKTGKNVTTPEQVKFSDAVKIQEVVLSEGGCDKAAAITENGDLYMWGNNDAYGLGIGENSSNASNSSYPVPQKIEGISNVVKVRIFGNTTVALTESGDIYVWGNAYDYTDQLTHWTPEKITCMSAIKGTVVDVQISQAGYTVLTSDGDLYAWCYSGDYQSKYCGRTDSGDIKTPVVILNNIKSYYSGNTSFAISNNGDLYSWGENEKGETGTGTYGSESFITLPTKVNGVANVKEMVSSLNLNSNGISGAYAAITNDQKLYMWGSNAFGIFGNSKEPNTGAYDDNNYYLIEAKPVQIADQVQRASYYSYESSFYLKIDGSLWASGNARYGVLGEQRDEDPTQNKFYRTSILITLKGKSPSLVVKDDNNSGTIDPEEPDSGDIDDGDHGNNQKPGQENKDNTGDKQQDQVGGQTKPSTPATTTKKTSTTTSIKVSGTNLLKVQNLKGKKAKVTWKKNTKAAGYQIQYSLKKNFKSGVKTINIKKNKTVKTTIKKLKKKKTYYVRIRCSQKSGKKTIYSRWSSVKKVIIKK